MGPGPALNEKFLGICRGAEVFIFSLRPRARCSRRRGLLLSRSGLKEWSAIEMAGREDGGGGGESRIMYMSWGLAEQLATSLNKGVEKRRKGKGGWRLLLGECGQAFLEMRRCLSRSYFSKCLIKGITKARWEAWCAAGLLGAHWPQTRGLIWTLCEERSGDQEQINPHWVDDSCPSREMKFPSGSLPQRCLACGLEPGSLSCMYVKVRVDGQMDNAHHGVYHKENLPQSTILDNVCTPLQKKFFFTD